VETVRRAPSAGYSQGQRLLVVTEPAGRADVARVLGEAGWGSVDDREPWLETAPVHVLVCTREDDYLLAAVDEGLAAGVSGVPREAAGDLRARFGIPEDVTVVALVTVGTPAPDPGWSAVTSRRTEPRRNPSDVVRWERW
jgi:nitroreductase